MVARRLGSGVQNNGTSVSRANALRSREEALSHTISNSSGDHARLRTAASEGHGRSGIPSAALLWHQP